MPQELGSAIQENAEDHERDDCDSDEHSGINAKTSATGFFVRVSAGISAF